MYVYVCAHIRSHPSITAWLEFFYLPVVPKEFFLGINRNYHDHHYSRWDFDKNVCDLMSSMPL